MDNLNMIKRACVAFYALLRLIITSDFRALMSWCRSVPVARRSGPERQPATDVAAWERKARRLTERRDARIRALRDLEDGFKPRAPEDRVHYADLSQGVDAYEWCLGIARSNLENAERKLDRHLARHPYGDRSGGPTAR